MKEIRQINILMVDDHPMILEGYESILSRLKLGNCNISIDTANSCELAWEKITSGTYHIVLLDINFPVSEDSEFLSGEELGIKIRKEYPGIKLVILTFTEEPFRLNSILTNIKPAGFLLKGQTSSKNLIHCMETVITSPPYFGPKISELLQTELNYKFSLDETDRIILHQLSLGTKTKDLPDYVNLSLRSVEDRKKRLKKNFGVAEGDTKTLLQKARENGYI